MAARSFHCEIINRGDGPIEWVDDKIIHGDWVDDNVPSETSRLIQPGQSGHYDAESDGDIPIIGNIMTGTEGWTLFKTFSQSGHQEFIKIGHNLPYFPPPNSWHPLTGQVTRFDPRVEPGSAAFDERDKSDPEVRVHKVDDQTGTGNTLVELQSLPWLVVYGFASWGGIHAFGRFHCSVKLEVSGNSTASSTTIPFTAPFPPPATPVPQPYRFSNPYLWGGTWMGDRVTAVISVSPAGLLSVTITELQPDQSVHTAEGSDLSISRTFAWRLEDIQQVVLGNLDTELRNTVRQRLQDHGQAEGLLFEVQHLAGNERFASTLVTTDQPHYSMYREIGTRLTQTPGWKPQEIGGDFLIMPGDATLEIYSLVADQHTIGYALRYRRPSSGPLLYMANAAGAIDEMLYYVVRIH